MAGCRPRRHCGIISGWEKSSQLNFLYTISDIPPEPETGEISPAFRAQKGLTMTIATITTMSTAGTSFMMR